MTQASSQTWEWPKAKYRSLKEAIHYCAYCGRHIPESERTRDHIRAVVFGGSNDQDNIRYTCRTCNTLKQMGGECVGVVACAYAVGEHRNNMFSSPRITRRARAVLKQWGLMYGGPNYGGPPNEKDKEMTMALTICVDFDGVIHSYERGWQGDEIYGTVVPGFFEWLHDMKQQHQFKVVIYSSRSKKPEGRTAMFTWLCQQYYYWLRSRGKEGGYSGGPIPVEDFVHEKPSAFLTIDDRAICFKGDWKAEELKPSNLGKFKPWTQTRGD